MGLFDWLKDLITGTIRRDTSRLDADDVDEVVDTSGGPLKPGHRRRALRDRRLLPKRRLAQIAFGAKRKKVMSFEEATRLFSGTCRTPNRRVRDLLADEEQLARLGLPMWKTEEDVAIALAISRATLHHFSIHRERETRAHYVTFARPKRSGGERVIMAPKKRLKALLRKLDELLVRKLPLHDAAHGFRRGRSIRTGAEPHVDRRALLRMDLSDFFPSIHFGRVRGLLVAYGYSYPVAATLAVLMTEARRQPVEIEGTTYHVPVGPRHCVQGAPTSPGLANALVLKLDRRLAGLARARGFSYTRYADDLTFSTDDPSKIAGLRQVATRIITEEGFRVNRAKTRVMRSGGRQTVTGVVVNKTLGLSRQERRRMRAMLHQLDRNPQLKAVARGKLAYLAMLNPEQARLLTPSS